MSVITYYFVFIFGTDMSNAVSLVDAVDTWNIGENHKLRGVFSRELQAFI